MAKKRNPAVWHWLFFAIACAIALSGCIFSDVDDDRDAAAVCGLAFICLCLYSLKCLAAKLIGSDEETDGKWIED